MNWYVTLFFLQKFEEKSLKKKNKNLQKEGRVRLTSPASATLSVRETLQTNAPENFTEA